MQLSTKNKEGLPVNNKLSRVAALFKVRYCRIAVQGLRVRQC